MDNKILELLQEMNSTMKVMQKDVSNIDKRLYSLQAKVDAIDVQQKEDTQILRALEGAKDVHAAKLDKIENDIAHLSGEVKNIRVNLNAVEGITAKIGMI